MYGKIFESTFTGSMFGAGPTVFALWAYVIANANKDHQVEINPRMLAACLGTTDEDVEAALAVLTRPDPRSRTPDHDGVRLLHVSAFTYHVVNHDKYRKIRNEEERREYNREAQKKHRQSVSRRKSMTVIDSSAVSAHADGRVQIADSKEEEADAREDTTAAAPDGNQSPAAPRRPAAERAHALAVRLGGRADVGPEEWLNVFRGCKTVEALWRSSTFPITMPSNFAKLRREKGV